MLCSRQYLCSLCARRCSVFCPVRIRQCSRMFTCACDAGPDEKSSGSSLLHSAYTSSCSALGNGRKSTNSLTASSNTTTTSTCTRNSNQVHISSNKTNGHPPSQFSDPNHKRNSSPTFNRNSSSSGESRGAQQPQAEPQPQEQQEQPMHSVLASTSGHRGDAGGLAYNAHGDHSSHGYMLHQLDAGPWTLPAVQPLAAPPSSASASQNYATDYAHSPHINGALPPKQKSSFC